MLLFCCLSTLGSFTVITNVPRRLMHIFFQLDPVLRISMNFIRIWLTAYLLRNARLKEMV